MTCAREYGDSSHSVISTVSPLRDDVGDDDVGVVAEGLGERALRLGLEGVVELVRGAGLELGDQRLDVDAGEDRADAARQPGELAQVAHQGLAGAGVLHLHGHVAAVVQRPLCTCPMLAAAVGPPSSQTSCFFQVGPRSFSSWSRTVWVGIGGASSCSLIRLVAVRRHQLLGQGGLAAR